MLSIHLFYVRQASVQKLILFHFHALAFITNFLVEQRNYFLFDHRVTACSFSNIHILFYRKLKVNFMEVQAQIPNHHLTS